jgi:hypothetical protein
MASRTKHLIIILCRMIVGLMFSGTTLRPGRRNFDAFALVCLLVSLWFWYDLISWKETLRYIDLVKNVGLTLVSVRLYLQEETFRYIYCGVCVCVWVCLRSDQKENTTFYLLKYAVWSHNGYNYDLIFKKGTLNNLIRYACCSADSLRLDKLSMCEFIRSLSH